MRNRHSTRNGFGVLLIAMAVLSPDAALAVPPSPRQIEAGRATWTGRNALRAGAFYETARAAGVDRPHKQFALNCAIAPLGATAHRNILVVLCDFEADTYGPAWHPDAASTPEYYEHLFFSDDPGDGLTSLREYYRDQSNGRLIVSGRVTSGWLTMPHSYDYYVNGQSGMFGSYPRNARKLAEDAMTAAYASFGNDLSFFDNDGWDGIPHSGDDDGYIDAVCVVHPGVGAEIVYPGSDSHLWSHEWTITTYSDCPGGATNAECLPGMALGDVRGFLYFVVAEYYDAPGDQAVGTYFAQFGYTLGLVSLYGSGTAGLGFYSLMGLGGYLPIDPADGPLASHPANLDAWSRQVVGFETPVVPATTGYRTLAPAAEGGGSLKVWTNGDAGFEYFLMENRSQMGSDEFLPGAGLLIYHVDDTRMDNVSGPPRVRVVQADGHDDLGTYPGNYGDPGDFFPGSANNHTWTEATSPNSRDYAGQDTQIRATDIELAGSGAVSFHLSVSTAPALRLTSYRIEDGDNGFPDQNERVSLFVSVQNLGLASNAVIYTIATADPYAVIATGSSSSNAVATGETVALSDPFILDFGAPPILPHVVVLTLNWSDGSASGVVPFAISIGMRAGLSENFESGAAGWTHEWLHPWQVDEWHESSSRAHGGSMSMKVGSSNDLGSGSNSEQTYLSGEDAGLISPMFQLERGSTLTFYSWIDAETNGGKFAWDGGRVELALNGGAWRPLEVLGGYGYTIEENSWNALRGEAAFSGSAQNWRRVVVDLSRYTGAAQLRFRFATDYTNKPTDALGNLLRYYEGWYVDDVDVSPGLAASVDLDPNVINLRARAPWVTAYIEPAGFEPSSIVLSSVRLAGSVPAAGKVAAIGDHDRDGMPDLMVKFSRELLDPLLTEGVVELEITGSLATGEDFSGTDWVRVIQPGGGPMTASVAPNPLNPVGVLTFSMGEPGGVQVRLFDLHGRLVRTLLEESYLSAGVHEVQIDGRGKRGEILASGLYFYRVEAAQGTATGRIAILK